MLEEDETNEYSHLETNHYALPWLPLAIRLAMEQMKQLPLSCL